MSTRVLAVDCGATSVRVCVVDLDTPGEVQVIHRASHAPVDGRWAWEHICTEIEHGLRLGLEAGPVASIGIDTWAVDYGLLDSDGRLLSAPHSYRSARTEGWREVRDRIGAQRLYEIAGLQELAFNTIFQLAAHDRDELARATCLLMLPELLVHHLTGNVFTERSSAGSTGLVNVASRDWSDELIEAIEVPRSLFTPISAAGTLAGDWHDVPVHLVAGHDTASAFASVVEAAPSAAIVSTGTWFLVGAHREEADTSAAARAANFTNETGALGGYRFLKNVPGLYLLEQCRSSWGNPDVGALIASATRLPAGPTVDVFDPSLEAPADMASALEALSGLRDPAAVTRCILDSLVLATCVTLEQLGQLRGQTVTEVHLLGGGTRITALPQLLSSALGVPVHVGSAEATAIGNARVQGMALAS